MPSYRGWTYKTPLTDAHDEGRASPARLQNMQASNPGVPKASFPFLETALDQQRETWAETKQSEQKETQTTKQSQRGSFYSYASMLIQNTDYEPFQRICQPPVPMKIYGGFLKVPGRLAASKVTAYVDIKNYQPFANIMLEGKNFGSKEKNKTTRSSTMSVEKRTTKSEQMEPPQNCDGIGSIGATIKIEDTLQLPHKDPCVCLGRPTDPCSCKSMSRKKEKALEELKMLERMDDKFDTDQPLNFESAVDSSEDEISMKSCSTCEDDVDKLGCSKPLLQRKAITMWKERGSEAIQQAIADEETARINVAQKNKRPFIKSKKTKGRI